MSFDLTNGKDSLEERYKGNWVVVYESGKDSPAVGLFRGIVDDYLLLQPFQGGRWQDDGSLVLMLIDKPEPPISIYAGAIIDIDPTTEQSVRNYCTKQNKAMNGESKKESKEEID